VKKKELIILWFLSLEIKISHDQYMDEMSQIVMVERIA
jgi:hypothetical protein